MQYGLLNTDLDWLAKKNVTHCNTVHVQLQQISNKRNKRAVTKIS